MLLQTIIDNRFRSVSVIGMAKNTGKTFTLNHLSAEARRRGLVTALTTIGFDGEDTDRLFFHAKPRIRLSPGQFVANGKRLLLESGLDWEIAATTDVMTPFGEIVIARSCSNGTTLLAGPSTRYEMTLVKDELQYCGAELIFIDGAIDRRALSSPLLTDTTILAVGPEAAWDREVLVEQVRYQVKLLTLPAIDDDVLAESCRALTAADKFVCARGDGSSFIVGRQEFVENKDIVQGWAAAEVATIYVRGMLTDGIAWKLLAAFPDLSGFCLVVQDGTDVFLSRPLLNRIEQAGAVLRVLDAVHLTAVTINPFSSRFGMAEPVQLLNDIGQIVDPIPCFDLCLGMRYSPERRPNDVIP